MKKILLPTLLICMTATGLLFTGCEDDGLSVSFDQNFNPTFTIEKGLIVNQSVDATSDPIKTDTETLKENNISLDKLESAKLKSAKLTIVMPQGEDFSFVESFSLYIKGQGMTEELIGSKSAIGATDVEIDLDVEDTELIEHIKSGEFTVRGAVKTDEDVTTDVDIKADMSYKLTGTIF